MDAVVSDENILEVRGLSAWYGKRQVLRGVDLNASVGRVTAIIGPSGCGKSTLLSCLNRTLELVPKARWTGEVKLSGQDTAALDADAVRSRVGMVMQKPTPFPFSVERNITYALRYRGIRKRSELSRIVREQLSIVGLLDELEGDVSRSALELSGGQQQRLCIARALLRRPKILILDDSTSAVDTKTDAKIREGLASYLPNTTKLIIAQRISSVQDADRIIVMEGGRIKDIGNHDELLKTSEIYRETFTSQNKMSAEGEEAAETVAADTEASAPQAQTQEGGEAHE